VGPDFGRNQTEPLATCQRLCLIRFLDEFLWLWRRRWEAFALSSWSVDFVRTAFAGHRNIRPTEVRRDTVSGFHEPRSSRGINRYGRGRGGECRVDWERASRRWIRICDSWNRRRGLRNVGRRRLFSLRRCVTHGSIETNRPSNGEPKCRGAQCKMSRPHGRHLFGDRRGFVAAYCRADGGAPA
jgi:hypothetical protein